MDVPVASFCSQLAHLRFWEALAYREAWSGHCGWSGRASQQYRGARGGRAAGRGRGFEPIQELLWRCGDVAASEASRSSPSSSSSSSSRSRSRSRHGSRAAPVPTVLMCSHLRLVLLGLVRLTSRFEAPDAPGAQAAPAARAAVASSATVARVQRQALPMAHCPLHLEATSLPMPGPDPQL